MKKLLVLFIVFFSFFFNSNAQTQKTSNLSADQYFHIGDSLMVYEGKYDESIKYFELAASDYQKKNMWQKYYRSKNKVAKNLLWKYKFEVALKLINENIVGSINKLGKNNSEEIFGHYLKSSYHLRFERNFVKGHKIIELLLNNEDEFKKNYEQDFSFYYFEFAVYYLLKGGFDKTIFYIKKSLNILGKYYPENHPYIAHSYNVMSQAFGKIGSYNLAIEYGNKALYLFKERAINNKDALITIYAQLGSYYSFVGNFELANKNYKIALNICEKNYTSNNLFYADILESIAIHYQDFNFFTKSLEYHLKSLQIRKNLKLNSQYLVADSYSSIGKLYLEMKKFELARQYFIKAIKLLKDSGHEDLIYCNYGIGRTYIETDDLENALTYIEKAINKIIPDNKFQSLTLKPDDQIYLLKSLNLKAKILLMQGEKKDLKGALKIFELADKLIDKVRASYQLKSDQINLGNIAKEIYKESINLCYKLAQNQTKDRQNSILEKAFYFSEKSKSIILSQNLSELNAKQIAGIPDSLLLKEKELNTEKNFLIQRLNSESDSSSKLKYRNLLFNINREHESLIAVYKKSYLKYYNLRHNTQINSVKDIQNSLSKNNSVISYFVGDSTLFTFLINQENFIVKQAILKDSLVTQIKNLNKNIIEDKIQEYSFEAHSLYKLLIQPVENDLNGKKVILVPDGPLWYLSFDVLLSKSPKKIAYNKLNYLVKDYSFNYAYSCNLYMQEKKRLIKNKKPECIAFSFTNLEKLNTSGNKISLRNFRNMALEDLPGSRKEIKAVSQIMDGLYYYGKEANEKNFKENATEYSIIHLALHGTVDEEDPMKSRLYFNNSKIRNKRINNSSSAILQYKHNEQNPKSIEFNINKGFEEDNYLYAYELYNMELNADLVVLSACNTGLGKLEKGEGVMSLGRSFTYAGCKSIIISQWQLSDYAAPILLESFYEYIDEGLPKDEALRNAKLDYLNKTSNNVTSSPHFWGSLIQIGDNVPIRTKSSFYFYWLGIILTVCAIGFHWKLKQ